MNNGKEEMNKNISIINEYLYLVNFDYIDFGYIKELSFIDTKICDFVCITNDGVIVLNSNDKYSNVAIPILKQLMILLDNELDTETGYMKCLRGLVRDSSDWSDEMLIEVVGMKTIEDFKESYLALCKWEMRRRQNFIKFKKGNNKKFNIKNLFQKGGK